ncbi:PepSY domain-containing protein [Ornithinibacillus scapharcae]|uniref:PepSY domain-containing protein n=1 Tax=Ornithinibacillus scapharcae TaxID=1147159 RepID=UPI000225B37B|nr:PepSY domain-containing protein [Ornithinibacillus scapharcae]
MNKKLITGVVTVGLLLGGTTMVAASMNENEVNDVQKEGVVKSGVVVDKEDLLSVKEVQKIALSEQDGYVESIDLEKEHGRLYYEVDIEQGNKDYEIDIDASTGEVLTVDFDDDSMEEEKSEYNFADFITVEKAKEIAVGELGGKVIEIELDEDDGRYEYDLELRTDVGEADITLDAVTGEILEVEID